MTAFKMNGLDFAIENNKMPLVDGVDEVKQRLNATFRFFKNTWFLDLDLGLPYFQDVLGQKKRFGILQNIFRRYALAVNGVIRVNDVLIDFIRETRVLSVDMNVTTESGVFYYERAFEV